MRLTKILLWGVIVLTLATSGLAAGEDGANLAVAGFLVLINLAVFLVPVLTRWAGMRLSDSELLSMFIARACYSVGIWFLVNNTAFFFSMAETYSVANSKTLLLYMNLFGWFGYGLMMFIVFRTLFDGLNLWKQKKVDRRMGDV